MTWIEFAKKYQIENPIEFYADLESIKPDNSASNPFMKPLGGEMMDVLNKTYSRLISDKPIKLR